MTISTQMRVKFRFYRKRDSRMFTWLNTSTEIVNVSSTWHAKKARYLQQHKDLHLLLSDY